ncbi:MAG: oxidoreductase [Paracoccaceae bacterium]
MTNASLLAQPLTLPSGAVLKNRLIKSPMSDSLGDGAGNATAEQARLYERWAQGGTALSIIGEAQVTPHFPEKPGNLVLIPDADLGALQALATKGAANNTHIWPQLGHAGALAHAPVSHAKGPSPLDLDGLRCDGLSLDDIHALPPSYAQAALVAKQAGFSGVQIHAGHGFLFSQFLSPLFNHRTDAYGGAVPDRFRVIGETIDAVRRAVGPNFPIGIRINATDKLAGGLTTQDALHVITLLDQTSVDLIDISGGTYFPGAPSSSDGTNDDGAYFADFARQAKTATAIPLTLTGGIKTRQQAVEVLASGAADAVGLARTMCLDPALPDKWMTPAGGDPAFPRFQNTVPGGITAWYSMRLTAIAEDREDAFDMDLQTALDTYDTRDADRSLTWRVRFPDVG